MIFRSAMVKRSVLFLLALTACFQPRPDAAKRQTFTFDAVQALSASSTTVSSGGIRLRFTVAAR
jgi:hypothetical protein